MRNSMEWSTAMPERLRSGSMGACVVTALASVLEKRGMSPCLVTRCLGMAQGVASGAVTGLIQA